MTSTTVTPASVSNAPPILVTGAASGIGAAVVAQLRAAGRNVIGVDRLEGDDILACDLADPTSITALAPKLPPALAGLANVAGVPGTASPQTVLTVNALAPRLLVSAVLERLAPGAAIVNVASVAAHRNTQPIEALRALRECTTVEEIRAWIVRHPVEGPEAYDTSKRVLVDWTRDLTADLAPRKVRCVSVSPGPVETPILKDFVTSMGAAAIDGSEAIVGRHGYPDEIAAAVTFALSPAASWVNGIDITVDGGLLAIRSATKNATSEGPRR